MIKKKSCKTLIEYMGMTLGCAIMAFALVLMLEPHTIAPGGVTGLAIVLKKVTGVPISVICLSVDIPLFILGTMLLGKEFGIKTLYGIFTLPFFIEVFTRMNLEVITKDLLLSSIFGGLVLGIGLGIVFRSGGTTGGTDLAGAILHKYFPNLSIAKLMTIVDFAIVILAGVVNRNIENSLYSVIALYIIVKVADFIMEGMDNSKAFFVITEEPEEISSEVMNQLERGVTALKGKGMYTSEDKEVLFIVVNRTEEIKLKNIIQNIDENAFVMVANVHEVLGNGFKTIKA